MKKCALYIHHADNVFLISDVLRLAWICYFGDMHGSSGRCWLARRPLEGPTGPRDAQGSRQTHEGNRV